MKRLALEKWSAMAAAHRKQVACTLWDGLVTQEGGRRVSESGSWDVDFGRIQKERIVLDKEHPVFNFIRAYFGIKEPKQVRKITRFSPGAGVLLEDADLRTHAELVGSSSFYQQNEDTLQVVVPQDKIDNLQWYKWRLVAARDNQPVYHCFGLHEWAMLYQGEQDPPAPSSQFQSLPLRVSQQVINQTVEERGVYCTHFDAMRFFSPGSIKHTHNFLDKRAYDKENPACLHSSMDLFNIAFKISPVIPSSLLLQTLLLAVESRKIDISASPYDVTGIQNLRPIPIETKAGKKLYQEKQRDLLGQSQELRNEMIKAIDLAISLSPGKSLDLATRLEPDRVTQAVQSS